MPTMKECQELAIAKAKELNEKLGFKKWNTVSMSYSGNWFADECLAEEMTLTNIFHSAPYGLDLTLKEIPMCDTPINDWINSKAEVN